MTLQQYIETVIQPKLMGDGGWVEYKSLDGTDLTLVFRGECSKCLILSRCCDWIEQEISRDLGKVVHITAIRKRPYFQEV